MYTVAVALGCLLTAALGRRVAFNPSSTGASLSASSPAFTSSRPQVMNNLKKCNRPIRAESRRSRPIVMDDAAQRDDIRNIAIVAHVDHGKTTLVDSLLEEDLNLQIGKDDRLMDGNDQEKERGITILAKNAAIKYNGIKVNIVDTPGHADFGGEVERVLGMVDGVLLVVDAQEGPKPQTRFVLKKALAMGHKILVVINKVDKPASRTDYVIDKTFDLFCELGATDEQTDFKVVYSSAINRQSGKKPETLEGNMNTLKDAILELPKPYATIDKPLQLQIVNVGSDQFIGRLGVGRITSGTIRKGMAVGLSAGPGEEVKQKKITELFVYDAMGKKPVDEASAGDIVVFAGIQDFDIGNTVVDPADPQPLEPIEVEIPTMSITMGVNKSPLAGKSDAKFLTSREIKARLDKELETNVALKVEDSGEDILVYGRGLLHLTVLIESMRREGFEIMVGPPKVIEIEEDGQKMEPWEMVDVEVPEEYSGAVIQMLNERKGNMIEMGTVTEEGMLTIQYEVPVRGMVGIKSKVLTASKGLAVMTTTFAGYKPSVGEYPKPDRGNIVATDPGTATTFSLMKAQTRGELFIGAKTDVYPGMIIGQNAKQGNMGINVVKQKQLTNVRSAGKDDNMLLTTPQEMTLEDAVEYVKEGEFVECTPDAIRMGYRKMPKDVATSRR
mmetsp:Transcript_109973/g.211661  ORF Transcript_109973/g.211661 Transcript_109973/m.211661 type:complete len:671 (-) Transcript_109973:191-2203(-)